MSDRPDIDQSQPSAEIIPFPPRTPQQPLDRLQRALVTLAEAQAAQKIALERWRRALTDLQSSVGHLGVSVNKYQQNLEQISTRMEN
jgi:hypothetical protein